MGNEIGRDQSHHDGDCDRMDITAATGAELASAASRAISVGGVRRNAISIAAHALHCLHGCRHMGYQPVTKFVLPTAPAKAIL
jgi:hypothetical protein